MRQIPSNGTCTANFEIEARRYLALIESLARQAQRTSKPSELRGALRIFAVDIPRTIARILRGDS